MSTFGFNINADQVWGMLGRLQSALGQLENMSAMVELDPPGADSGGMLLGAEALGGVTKKRRKGEETESVTVNEVPSRYEPLGHATISIDEDTFVGLVPNSLPAAAAGLAEDLTSPLFFWADPAAQLAHFVPAHIEEDYRTPDDHATIHVTPEQAGEMRAFTRQAGENPQVYDALYQNCAEWVEEVLNSAGMDVPAEITPGGLVDYLKSKYLL